MDRPQEEFCRIVNEYLSSRDEEHEPVTRPGCFIETAGVLLQLLLEPARNEVTLSATIFDGVEDPGYLVPEIIADFNAVQLFNGGYCLLVEDTFSGLYVNQHHSLGSLRPTSLGALLEDFARRTWEWRRWYRTVAEDFWPSLVPAGQ